MPIPELKPGAIGIIGLLGGILLLGGYYGLQAFQEHQAQATSYNPIGSAEDAHALAFQSDDPHKLYVATHDGLVRAFHDREWSRVGRVKFDLEALAAHPTEPLTFYAGGHDGRKAIGIARTTDGGFTWSTIALQDTEVHALTISRVNPQYLWAMSNGRLHRSLDGGDSWRSVAGESVDIRALAAGSDKAAKVYAASPGGVHRSDDGGDSWTLLADLRATAVAAHPTKNDTLLVGADGEVHVSTDNGATWQELGLDAPDDITGLAISPDEPATYYASTASARIHKTEDAGRTWARVWPPA